MDRICTYLSFHLRAFLPIKIVCKAATYEFHISSMSIICICV